MYHPKTEEGTLRMLLWLRHDADHAATLYGDDGEMQCGICKIDFLRMPAVKIAEVFRRQGEAALDAADSKAGKTESKDG